MTYIDVTHEACWIADHTGVIAVIHNGHICSVANGYRVSGVEDQPWRFKVEKKVGR